jgi:hypothetical protein
VLEKGESMSNVSGSASLSFVCVPVSPDTVMVAKLPAFEYKSTLTAIEMVKVFVEPGHGVDCTISLRIKAGLYTLRTEPSPGTEPGRPRIGAGSVAMSCGVVMRLHAVM